MTVRTREYQETVPARDVTRYKREYTCNGCGYQSDRDEDFNTILLYLDPDECVSSGFERHYCAECGDYWTALCAIIGADPEDISKSDFE